MHTFQINALIRFLMSSTFRTSLVHHQEDHLYMQFLYGMFFILVQTVILMMNP